MTSYRRLTFQLTPLLDLLLIVIFAQYLDIRTSVRRETVRLESERIAATADLLKALDQLAVLREQLQRADAAVRQSDSLQQEVRQLRVERDRVGSLVRELFGAKDPEVAARLRPGTADAPGLSTADIARIRQRFQALGQAKTDEVIDHLVTFEEMRKRCDVWELYLQDNGVCVLTFGDKRLEFRGETRAQFANRLYEAYKTLPQPKSLVIVLMSYGDARFGDRQAAFDALPDALERMRNDTAGRTRFEYAILGYRVTPSAAR